MKKTLISLYYLLLINVAAQTTQIAGSIRGFEGRHILLLGYNGVEEFPVDSALVPSSGIDFSLRVTLPYSGLYKLLVEKGNNRLPDKYIDLLLRPGSDVRFTTEYPYISDSLKITKGDEQSYFTRFTQNYNKTLFKIYLLEDLLSKYPPDDPFHGDITKNKKRLLADKEALFARFRDSRYPLANRYIDMLRQWDMRTDYFSDSFYKGIDVSDTLWIRNTLLHQKIGQYYSYLMGQKKNEDFLQANKFFIDAILDPIQSNPPLWNNIFTYLVQSYKTMNYPDALEYLSSKYLTSEVCTDPSQRRAIDEILQSLHAIKAGDALPTVVLKRNDESDFTFPSDLSASQAGLLILWSGRCNHCRESMPYWKDLYHTYGPKGLHITALHIESDITTWKASAESLPPEWTHLHDPNGWNGYAKTLHLLGTPGYVLYDRDYKLLLKSHDLTEVRNRLKNMF
ncbi:MAG: TlpA family protein disulfide reductase [Thermaurantimonas sp.]